MAVSKRLRFEILTRDNHACRYCGACAPDATLTIDHVVPTTLGGSDEPSNLVTACKDCNAGKSSVHPGSPLVEDVAADALRWKQAIDLMMDSWREQELDAMDCCAEFYEAWSQWGYGVGDARQQIPIDDDWDISVLRWLSLGFEVGDLVRLIPRTMKPPKVPVAEKWRYYCGIVWATLRDIQADAKSVVEMYEATPKETFADVEPLIAPDDADLYAAALDYEFKEEPLGPVVARLIWPIPVLG